MTVEETLWRVIQQVDNAGCLLNGVMSLSHAVIWAAVLLECFRHGFLSRRAYGRECALGFSSEEGRGIPNGVSHYTGTTQICRLLIHDSMR